MEKCKLTQVPCRAAIVETINANKNRYSLQRTYELAKLFQLAETDFLSLSKEDQKKYFVIRDILRTNDLKTLQRIGYFVNALLK